MQLQAIFITSLISAVSSAGLERRQNSDLASCTSTLASSDLAIISASPTLPDVVAALTVLATQPTNTAVLTPFCGASATGNAALSSYSSAVSSWSSQNSAWLSSQLASTSICPAYSTFLSEANAEPTSASSVASAISSLCTAYASLATITSHAAAAPTNLAAYAGAAIAGAIGVVAVI